MGEADRCAMPYIHTYLHNCHIVVIVPLVRAGVDAQDLGAGDAAVEEPVEFVWMVWYMWGGCWMVMWEDVISVFRIIPTHSISQTHQRSPLKPRWPSVVVW